MRGKGLVGRCPFVHDGITPAYAGKRGLSPLIYLITKDHPRLCGEKDGNQRSLAYIPGSPPPMRGKEVALNAPPEQTGITPAYAGKSAVACVPTDSVRDHPRLCGEKHS